MDDKVNELIGSLKEAADKFIKYSAAAVSNVKKAAKDASEQIAQDMRKAQEDCTYDRCARRKRDIWFVIYLVTTPAIAILYAIAKVVGWI
ncbi:hypothetical protein LJC56_02960 [Christensenellaceae bacterium OttesenSCG-928-K19]|nr:hypothetical protein [Christensenellaceae bacterium OttesenSCG-928-K19]